MGRSSAPPGWLARGGEGLCPSLPTFPAPADLCSSRAGNRMELLLTESVAGGHSSPLLAQAQLLGTRAEHAGGWGVSPKKWGMPPQRGMFGRDMEWRHQPPCGGPQEAWTSPSGAGAWMSGSGQHHFHFEKVTLQMGLWLVRTLPSPHPGVGVDLLGCIPSVKAHLMFCRSEGGILTIKWVSLFHLLSQHA